MIKSDRLIALVAGGAGLVGSHLCRRLLADGKRVVCVDDLSTGQKTNIEPLLANPSFDFILHDVVQPLHVDYAVDEIYNLACPASPLHYQKDPVKTFKTSVIGSINLLELAREKHARILLASTSEVYGDALETPQHESYYGNVNPDGPRSCYDEGKRGAEALFCDYRRKYRLDTRIVRIFNTYVPLMRLEDGRVISTFIVQALKGESLTINGDGTQTRSFMYVDDLIEGLVRTMARDGCSTPLNLGNPDERTIRNLAERILQLTHSSSNLTYQPLPENDPIRRCPDISRAHHLLDGWHPKISLEEGLCKTITYFKSLV